MRHRHGLWFSVTAAFAFSARLLVADCVPALKGVSSIGVFPNHLAGPIATNGSIIGMAKGDSDPITNAIEFATFNSDLQQLTADTPVASRSFRGPAALFWTGSEFGLFYQAPSLVLTLQRIDATGKLIGSPIAIANHGWTEADEFEVTWVPARNSYAIARTVTLGPDRGVWLIVVSSAGTVTFDTSLTVYTSGKAFPHVVALDDGTVEVASARFGDAPAVLLTSVTPSGSIAQVPVVERAVTDLRLATNGTSILVIHQVGTTGGTQLRYAQATKSGNLITPDSLFLNGTGLDVAPQWLLWNPVISEWALVYIDSPAGFGVVPGDTRFRRFITPTTGISDTLLASNVTFSSFAAASAPLFVGGAYITPIARRLSSVEGSESYLVKSCPFFVTATADHPIWKPFAPITFTAHPSGGLSGFSYSWNFGDLSSASGQVVQHAYSLEGTYTVTLSATDAAGAQSVYKFTVQVVSQRRRVAR